MDVFNLFAEQQDWEGEQERDGYRHRVTRIGARLGAALLGASLYELPPGESTWPYHFERASEEWLLVVAGRPTLRTPEGERQLEPGDVAVFPQGAAGAHKVTNATDEPARVVILSSKSPLEVVTYPDSGKVGIWTRDDGYIAMLNDEPKLALLGRRVTAERARQMYAEGLQAFRRGDQDASRALNEEALVLAREKGDAAGEALGLVGLSRVAFRDGDYERVKSLAQKARELARTTGERSNETAPLHMLAEGTRLAGDYDGARELLLESLELNRELGDERWVTIELHNLAHVELHRGDLVAAERLFAERLDARNLSDPYERAMDALNAAALAVARGETGSAEERLREAERTLSDEGIVLDPDDQFELDWLRGQISQL